VVHALQSATPDCGVKAPLLAMQLQLPLLA